MTAYTLHYFNVRGRGEPIRLAFAAADVKFKDKRYTSEEWQALKPKTTNGQLPVMSIGGKMYSQSNVLLRHVDRELGLNGKTSVDALKIDTVLCMTDDFLNFLVKTLFEKDEAKKAFIKRPQRQRRKMETTVGWLAQTYILSI